MSRQPGLDRQAIMNIERIVTIVPHSLLPRVRFAVALGALLVSACAAHAQAPLLSGGQSVLPAGALLTTPVGGLERTNATAAVIPVSGGPFSRGLRVTV